MSDIPPALLSRLLAQITPADFLAGLNAIRPLQPDEDLNCLRTVRQFQAGRFDRLFPGSTLESEEAPLSPKELFENITLKDIWCPVAPGSAKLPGRAKTNIQSDYQCARGDRELATGIRYALHFSCGKKIQERAARKGAFFSGFLRGVIRCKPGL
ncbi:MAG TPA: hypothetical protein VHB73_02040 [Alphaproteobacteria bacterium]|nr:hypothetical protein [Alphaproteobacteria bacterium]